MSTTLTNGLKLPDKGSVDWYADMQSNYTILDGAVGTVAEHTSALAGKAPLVHTHTKADITDFPVYGTTAGTICEGNDSRLSDARTPVAHTHGKADVTDLLNSNFIPSANNSYDLGSSSYQWNNLYAKNYYYNGVAWGLDKANVWTGANTFQQNITYERTNFFHQAANPCYYLKDTELEKGRIPPAAHTAYPGMWQDKNSTFLGYVRFVEYDTGKQTAEIRVSNLIKNGALDPTGSTVNCTALLELQPSGEKSLIPEQNNDINLGTSTNKWKTLNGINPGALGIPSGVRQSISEYITNVNLGWNNQVTAVRDGYIVVTINDAAGNSIYLFNNTKQYSNGSYGNGSQGTGRLSCMLPVNEGDAIIIFIKAAALSDVFSAYLYVMNGNVNALPSS